MAEGKMENDNGRHGDMRSKRKRVPAHVCSCCQENGKPPRKSVGKKRPRKRLAKSVGVGNELLPGIVNDITLEFIIPRLSWRDLHVLRSVSPAWQQAIRNHDVYESRVRSQSTETLAIVAYSEPGSVSRSLQVSLYSPRDDTWSRLPRNPYLPEGIPYGCQCVSLDGKLYTMGGIKEYAGCQKGVGSAGVYVLDMAGQRQWQKCADMLEPRLSFGSGVIDGKIYVFGGISRGKPVCGSEVYNPHVNTWSRRNPMMSLRGHHGVFRLGQELFVHGGVTFYSFPVQRGADDGLQFRTKEPARPSYNREARHTEVADFLEVYDPMKDEWRLMIPEFTPSGNIFTAQGKVYLLTYWGTDSGLGIVLFDIDKATWKPVRSCSTPEGFRWYLPPSYNIVVDGELLGISTLKLKTDSRPVHGLLRSRGFRNEKENFTWELCACPNFGYPRSMWAIQI